MRLIDVEQVYCAECEARKFCGRGDVFCDIKSMPTVDAVPVVRCEDCVHQEGCTRLVTEVIYDPVLKENVYYHYQMGYCSYGERRSHHDSLCDQTEEGEV